MIREEEAYYENYTEGVTIRCPICNTQKRLRIPFNVIKQSLQLTTISIPPGLICNDSFQAFVDKNFKIRGYQKVDFDFSTIEFYEKPLNERMQESNIYYFRDLPISNKIIELLRNFVDSNNVLGTAFFTIEGQIIIKSEEKSKKTKIKIQLPLKKWTDHLIEIYILYRSGIPLYNHSFIEKSGAHDPTLISCSIIGILTILKEVFHGEKQMKIIDHGDRKLLFGRNSSEDIIFVLIVKDDLIVFHRKLNALIEEFDNNFKDSIINIAKTCVDSQNWKNLGELVQKHFLKL